eukprot:2404702-Rhodomonas_salina.2
MQCSSTDVPGTRGKELEATRVPGEKCQKCPLYLPRLAPSVVPAVGSGITRVPPGTAIFSEIFPEPLVSAAQGRLVARRLCEEVDGGGEIKCQNLASPKGCLQITPNLSIIVLTSHLMPFPLCLKLQAIEFLLVLPGYQPGTRQRSDIAPVGDEEITLPTKFVTVILIPQIAYKLQLGGSSIIVIQGVADNNYCSPRHKTIYYSPLVQSPLSPLSRDLTSTLHSRRAIVNGHAGQQEPTAGGPWAVLLRKLLLDTRNPHQVGTGTRVGRYPGYLEVELRVY